MSEVERKVSRFTWKKLLVGVGASALVVTGLIGVLHTSIGKPLLMKAGGCPAANAPPEGVQERQKQAVRETRGDGTAPKRVALGFTLDKSTLADVSAWAKANHVSCTASRQDTTYSCSHIPGPALPNSVAKSDLDEIEFTFRVSDKTLFAVSTWRWNLPEDRAAHELGTVASNLKADLGDPVTSEGDHTKLGKTLFAGSVVKYAFKDYLATVEGLNMPTKGITMHESYVTGVVD